MIDAMTPVFQFAVEAMVLAAIGGAFAFGIHMGRFVADRDRGVLSAALAAQSRDVIKSEQRAARAEALLSEAQEPRDFWLEILVDAFQIASQPISENCQHVVMLPKRNMDSEAWVKVTLRGRRRLT
jgi:hypothetical protein